MLLGLGLELRCGERQHVLTAFEKRFPSHIVLLAGVSGVVWVYKTARPIDMAAW